MRKSFSDGLELSCGIDRPGSGFDALGGAQALNRFLARRLLADELEARLQNKTRQVVKAEKIRESKPERNAEVLPKASPNSIAATGFSRAANSTQRTPEIVGSVGKVKREEIVKLHRSSRDVRERAG